MPDEIIYLYAVTVAPDPIDLPAGIGDRPVWLVDDGLRGVVSAVPEWEFNEVALRRNLENLDWLATVARSHHRVVEGVVTVAPTAPMRICTVYRDEAGVRRLLKEKERALNDVLRRVSGRREWGVKVYGSAEAGDDEPLPETGTAYMRQLQSRRRKVADQASQGERIHARMRELSVASRRYPEQDRRLSQHSGRMLLNAAYLVETTKEKAFIDLLESSAATSVRVQITGPWAPYSFVQLAET